MVLVFNLTGINDKVKVYLDKSKKNLKSAKDIIYSIKIPSDFTYGVKLKNMTDNITDIRGNITDINKWLDIVSEKFKNVEAKNINLINENISSIGKINLTSTVKKAIRSFNISVNEKITKAITIYKDKLNDSWSERVISGLLEDYSNGKIDLDNMTDSEFDEAVVKMIVKQGNIDEVFDFFAVASGKYGVDQGLFYGLSVSDIDEYKEVQTYLNETYNIDLRNSAMIMSALDSIGACSYADVVNNIIAEFKDTPELFESIFGFPLYKQTKGGWRLNDAKLLVDLYVYANKKENNGKLIIKDGDNYIVNMDAVNIHDNDPTKTELKDGDYQQYMSNSSEIEVKIINRYLASKTDDSNIKFVIDDLGKSWKDGKMIDGKWTFDTKMMDDEQINNLITKVEKAIRRR